MRSNNHETSGHRVPQDAVPCDRFGQRGVVLLLVLWVLAAVGVMAALVAAEIRLSARSVQRQSEGLDLRAASLSAVNCALIELTLSRMPQPLLAIGLGDPGNPGLRFDGRALSLTYPQPDGMTVRIFDHAGKINLSRLTEPQMQALLAQRPGLDRQTQTRLLAAWADWLDGDDLSRLHGAERDEALALGLLPPRNGPLETVEELFLIRGFAEAFADLDPAAAFTVYGSHRGINPNLAGAETLALLPGLTPEAVEAILALRQQGQEIRSPADLVALIEPGRMAALLPWLHFAGSSYFTIAVEQGRQADEESRPVVRLAHQLVVQVQGPNRVPKVLKVMPLSRLPPVRIGDRPEWR